MPKKGGCNRCCCALAVFLSLAIAAVALFLGLKLGMPSFASDSAQVTLVNATTPVSSNSTMSTVTPAITPAGEVDCSSRNSSCGECIADLKCYFCYKDNTCRLYPASAVLPTSECPLAQVRWGTCDGIFQPLVIGLSVSSGVIVLLCCGCLFCRFFSCRDINIRLIYRPRALYQRI
ncbi:uncharacterized protein LOC144871579 [Branchiostoma floridae x Branchiostoma japonicum]